jgi:hypothetical protein
VEQMAAKLSPASIRDYSNIVKAVVASAIYNNGEEKFPRKWNDEFLDLPTLRLACRLRTASRRRGIEPRDRQTHQRRLPNAFHRAKGEARRNSTVPKDEERRSGSGLVLSARGNAEGIYRYANVGPSV